MIFFLGCFSSSVERTPSPDISTQIQQHPPLQKEPLKQPPKKRSFSLFFIDKDQQLHAVSRDGPSKKIEQFALEALYKEPSEKEKQQGLTLIKCQSTAAKILSIKEGLATIQLQGGCGGCGSIGIYDSIVQTAKQFTSIDYVHILDPSGKTQALSPRSDARPSCLEP